MYFKSVELKNFRNYKDQNVEFHEKLNLFLGHNAQGKTNLLESLYIMGMGRSFRTNNDKEMINFEKDFSKVRSLIYDEIDEAETEIDITYKKEGKIIKVDGVKLGRTQDLLEHVYVVIFSPEDLRIIKDGPDSRRRFLDRELCQLKPKYYSDLGNYKKILKQRNTLLKQNRKDQDLFGVFNEELADYGVRIALERKKFTERLQKISESIHSDISGGKEKFSIAYETCVTDRDAYIKKLEKDLENDIYKGHTGFGPHKDDLKTEINGTDIRIYGSQGQQRSAALSMKLAEISLIKEETGHNAVLLLDDVLSELDQDRQRFLIESMRNVQVFITATEIDRELLQLLPSGNSYSIVSGQVKLLT